MRRLIALTALCATLACTDPTIPVGCTRELRVRFAPAETTLVVGQGFTASVQLATCGGAVQLTDSITWRATNSQVAVVDSATGQVIALAPGETGIAATGAHYHEVGSARLSVRAQAP